MQTAGGAISQGDLTKAHPPLALFAGLSAYNDRSCASVRAVISLFAVVLLVLLWLGSSFTRCRLRSGDFSSVCPNR